MVSSTWQEGQRDVWIRGSVGAGETDGKGGDGRGGSEVRIGGGGRGEGSRRERDGRDGRDEG